MSNIPKKEGLRQIISRYVRGQASREEISFLQKYYDHFDDIPDGLQNLTHDERENLKSEIYVVIDKKMDSRASSRTVSFWLPRVAAASIFVLLGLGLLWLAPFREVNINAPDEIAAIPLEITIHAQDDELHHYLPDGSYVVLEPGSRIHYTAEFPGEWREVELTGEAYFDVQHDGERPFVVRSNGVTTRVVGTAFRIISLEEGHEFSISVTRGKVVVTDQAEQMEVLEKNDHLVLDMMTHEITKIKLEDKETADLEPSEYIMDDITVEKAVEIISQRWDCEFNISNQDLYNCEFTTSFLPTDNLAEVVAVISAVIGAEYEIEGEVVTLTGEGCDGSM